jgi:Domain of unknown function (DUF4396)
VRVPPTWLTVVAWISIAGSLACAVLIVADIGLRGNWQRMWIMNVVWPLTALYSGPLGLFAYQRWGRMSSRRLQHDMGRASHYGLRVSVGISDTHCGAGCALGDLIGEWAVFAVGAIAGDLLWPEYVADFALAFVFGIAFQYFAIVPMRHLRVRDGVVAALKSDSLSVTTFEIGLFGWMALMFFVFFAHPHLTQDQAAYWFLMQIGMMLGFATSYPANAWLIRRGIKEAM